MQIAAATRKTIAEKSIAQMACCSVISCSIGINAYTEHLRVKQHAHCAKNNVDVGVGCDIDRSGKENFFFSGGGDLLDGHRQKIRISHNCALGGENYTSGCSAIMIN